MKASVSLRRLFATLAIVLTVVSLLRVLQERRADSLLGLWDSGRLASKVMPEPVKVAEDQSLGPLRRGRISLQADPSKGSNLAEVFQWYGLDQRYVDATVQMDHLDPTRVPADPFQVVLEVPSSTSSSRSSAQ
jgi:hypothetical protein